MCENAIHTLGGGGGGQPTPCDYSIEFLNENNSYLILFCIAANHSRESLNAHMKTILI